MYRQYILGEDKYVELEVICRQPDATVVIPEATWELWRVSQDTPESSGSCEVDRQYIRAARARAIPAGYYLRNPSRDTQGGGYAQCHLRS